MNDVRAVLFDLDGTLCVHDQDDADLLETAFERVGTDPLLEPQHLYDVDTSALPTAESTREFFENLFDAAAADAGVDADPETITAAGRAFEDIRDPTDISFRPGAREALSTARDRYDVGLVTNGSEAVQTGKLETLGIRDAFDAAVFCDPTAGIAPKPDPTPVTMAVDDLGVAPGHSVLVGDDHGADVVGAHNAGAHSAWVPYFDDPATDPDPEPTHVFATMAEVAGALEQ